jgi:hypothetical protein
MVHGWVPKFGLEVGVPKLGPKVVSQGCVPSVGPNVGFHGWVPRLGFKAGSKVGSQNMVQ